MLTSEKGASCFVSHARLHFSLLFFVGIIWFIVLNPLSAKITKWSNTLRQFVGNLPTNCLSVFDHFVGLAHKGLTETINRTDIYTLLCNFIDSLPY